MAGLFRAFLFRLRRDLTFRITLFIGIGLAILTTGLYLLLQFIMNNALEGQAELRLLSGEGMLINSLNPGQNFGIAIPVNLVSFTILEFTHGTIRNKIIAGNSKAKIYASLYLSGLVFSIALIVAYAALCTLLGTIFGGFHPVQGTNIISTDALSGTYTTSYVLRIVVVGLVSYVSITSFAVFIATLTRQIGGAIPLVIVAILILSIASSMVAAFGSANPSLETFCRVLRYVDPFYAFSDSVSVVDQATNKAYVEMPDETFFGAIGSNLVYAAGFFLLGIFTFRKRDVK